MYELGGGVYYRGSYGILPKYVLIANTQLIIYEGTYTFFVHWIPNLFTHDFRWRVQAPRL
jgi:hypothetical protein